MILNREMECMDRESMTKLQSERLRNIVKTCYEKVPFYRKKMDKMGIKPEDIKGIEDIHRLPFTTKHDLRDEYPFGLNAVRMSEITRIHASSGTTGKPVVGTYTKGDVERWAEGAARVFAAGGVTKGDIVQVSYGYGLFTGGLGAHDAAGYLGAVQLPTSAGNSAKQIMLMKDLGSTVLACTPSYALHLAEVLEQSDEVHRKDLNLKCGFFGAEPWTEGMRKELEEKLGIKAYDIYGLTEMSGPGVGGECEMQDGTHLWRICTIRKSSIPTPLSHVLRANSVSLSSHRFARRQCLYCATAPVTSHVSSMSHVSADVQQYAWTASSDVQTI